MIVERLLKLALLGSTWVMYLLIGLSVISIAAMVERWWYFRKNREEGEGLRSEVAKLLRAGKIEDAQKRLAKSPAIEARIVASALDWRHGGPEAVSDAVDSELGRTRKDLERGSSLLGTIGNNAPFIGLFGTVLGVIEAFHHLADGANKAAMGQVMAGIAEALVATGVGIFVALPAVVAYNVAQKKIADIETATTALAKLVTAAIKTVERGGVVIEAGGPAETQEVPAGKVAKASKAKKDVSGAASVALAE